MENLKLVTVVVLIIGVFGIVAGIYFALTGGDFSQYFFIIFLGITLVGTSIINYKEWQKKVKNN